MMLAKSLLFFALVSTGIEARAELGADLEAKLEAQFVRYDAARERLLERLRDGGRVSRDEWEIWLAPRGDEALTAVDIDALRRDQSQRIAAAKARAMQASVFDLAALRGQSEKLQSFCAAIPKGAMLHVHPSGTMTRETSSALLAANDPLLPLAKMVADFEAPEGGMLLYPEELRWLRGIGREERYSLLTTEQQARYLDFFVLPPGNHSFERFQAVFSFIDTAIPNSDAYEIAILDFARRAVAKGVLFVELRMGVTAASLPRLAATLERVERETGLIVRVDRTFFRTSSDESMQAALSDLLSIPANPWIVGIDLLANENHAPALETAQLVYGTVLQEVIAGRSQLRRTMHAGEHGDPRNPRDAMIMGSERLGHGVLLAQDPVALEYATRRGVPVEINLVSNLRLQTVPELSAHPYLDFLRLGLPASLSTDDEGIFETAIDHECVVAVEETDVTYAELKEMAHNSLRTAFIPESDKARLLIRLDEQFTAFELELQRSMQHADAF